MVGAVAALLALAVGIGGFFVLQDDDDEEETASSTTTSSTTSTTFGDTTSTTAAAATSSTTAAATTSTTARSTTTTTRGSTTTSTTTPGDSTTTTTSVSTSVCGSGTASVSFSAKDLVTDALSSSFTPQATVDNQVDKPIEVKALTLEVTYPGGERRNVTFATAGTVINPSTTASFTADKLTSAQRYQSVRFTRFTYFTAGQEATCTVSTP